MHSTELSRIVHAASTESDNSPLLIAHGLFGSARNWGAIAKRLSANRTVVAVDMRNHGDSPHATPHDYSEMADDLARVIDDLGGQADVLGHSMGGKAAMMLALTQPDMVRKLIIADIAPVEYSHSHISHIDVMRNLDLSGLTRRSEADSRLAVSLSDPALRAFFLQSLDLTDGASWKLNLDALEAGMPATVGWPDVAGRFSGPSLFVAGGVSDYLTDAHHPKIRTQFSDVTFRTIEGAGHWLHAEQPRAFVDLISEFLTD